MSFTVPSEHPDGGVWNVRPTNSGELHAVHSGTLEHTTAADREEAEATIAAAEARYTGKDQEQPEEPDEHEEAPPTQ